MKKNLWQALLDKNLVSDKKAATGYILAGKVMVNDRVVDKPGSLVNEADIIRLKQVKKYVARSGEKLLGALEHWKIQLNDFYAMDVGSSTGGFTEVLLNFGVKGVISVDVGYGIMDPRIRNDTRVYLFERTGIENLAQKDLPFIPAFFSMDVSFTSIKNVMTSVNSICANTASGIILLKPQFEISKEDAHKYLQKGVLRDKEIRDRVIKESLDYLKSLGWSIAGHINSPLPGKTGNIEELIYVRREGS